MRWRELAVVGLATTCSGRRLRPRQDSYDADNSTAAAVGTGTAVVVYTTDTVLATAYATSPSPPPSVQSDTSDTSPLVAPVPYSPEESPPPPPSYGTTTTTTVSEYSTGTSIDSATTYTSQQYAYAPTGAAPSGGSSPSAESPPGYSPPSNAAPSGYSPPADAAPSGYTPPSDDAPSGYSTPSGVSPPGYSPTAGTTAPPAYGTTATVTAPAPSSYQTSAANATCSGATLNVLEASLDWWYTKTLYHAVSTFSVLFNRNDSSTGWTLLPATTSFDVESALAAPDCTTSPTFVSSLNATSYAVECTPAASPVAAETTIITQTAYKPPPGTTGNGSLPIVTRTPKPASISVADATQDPYAQGTPFVFFSQYEIVSKSPTVFGNGSAGCAEATQTYTMEDAFSFEYTGADVNGSLLVNEGVVGDVNPALLGLVGQETAVAGSWVAAPTVVLLMQEVLVAQAALAAGTQVTESFLETPTATTPSFVTLAPTGPDGPPKITNSPRIENTQESLIVPTRGGGDGNIPTEAAQQTQGGNNGGGSNGQTQGGNGGGSGGQPPAESTRRSMVAFIAHMAQSDVTLQLPAAPTQTIVTAAFNGQTVTATRLSAVQGTQGAGAEGGLGGLLGSVGGPPSPTNAFDVLSQAEATFPGNNPTANAIINGMGGPAESGGGGGSPEAQEDNLPGGGDNGGQNGGGQNGGSGSSGSSDGGSGAITVGGAVITPNAQNEFNLGPGATLTPGGTAVVDGTTFSLNPAATAVVVNGVTQQLGSPAQATGGAGAVGAGAAANIPLITMGGAAITPNAATEYSIAPGATLTPGGFVVVDGTTMNLDASGRQLVVDGVTRNLVSPAEATPGAGAITVGGAIVTPNAASQYAVAPGATLTPGGSVVVDGTTYSLDSAATALVVDGETRTLASPVGAITISGAAGSGSGTTMAPILTIDGHTFHAINGGTTYVVDGQTLTMGEEETVTIDGTGYVISLAPSATRLIVETENANGVVTATSTQTLFPEQGSGSGAGASATSSQSGGPEQQVGNTAAGVAVLSWTSGVCFAVGSLALAIWL